MEVKQLLEKRKILKRKKPTFLRQDAHKKTKVGQKWRKPKGSDSKMRVGLKGYRRSVRKGWKSPSEVRGAFPDGLQPMTITTAKELDNLDPKTQAAVIGATVGAKKKITIMEAAIKKGIKVANYTKPEEALEKMKKTFQQKKKEREDTKKEREGKKEAAKKEAEKKAKEEKKEETDKAAGDKTADSKTGQEKKAEEKKERDKMLISSQ